MALAQTPPAQMVVLAPAPPAQVLVLGFGASGIAARLHRHVETAANAGRHIGKPVDVGLSGLQQLDDRLLAVGIHAQHLGGDRKLRLPGAGGDEGCGEIG